MPILFALVGPTGIGKSDLAIALAAHLNAEIISVDSRQIYKGFSIGTAQPPVEDLQKIKHHLINFLPPEKKYSVGEFISDVKKILAEEPQKKFILVGGTGLYLQGLELGLPELPFVAPQIVEEKRFELRKFYTENGVNALYEKALQCDKEGVQNLKEKNPQRLMRFIEVFETTGLKLSEIQKKRTGGLGKIKTFALYRDREILYNRINSRVEKMIQTGWLKEIETLAQSVPLEAPAWESLGYRELLTAKKDAHLLNTTLEKIKQTTRHYAKRQMTWFKTQIEATAIDISDDAKAFQKILNHL